MPPEAKLRKWKTRQVKKQFKLMPINTVTFYPVRGGYGMRRRSGGGGGRGGGGGGGLFGGLLSSLTSLIPSFGGGGGGR